VKEHVEDGVVALSFNYGQRHSKELECAAYNAKLLKVEHKVIDISFLSEVVKDVSALAGHSSVEMPTITQAKGDAQPVTYVPNRNMILLNIAVAVAESIGAEAVFYGAQAHDLYGYWDCTKGFVQRLNEVLQLNRKSPVRIYAPFVDYSKAAVVALGAKLGVPFGRTWSCYKGGEKACGTCPTCAERLRAFAESGVKEELEYE